ncbi:hypothetical protein BGZ83_002510 [Gryganskiella cystojenkinii]|nr:hypothetical protein BGZ83_002510 [Gryganskiella cystojenkinii]
MRAAAIAGSHQPHASGPSTPVSAMHFKSKPAHLPSQRAPLYENSHYAHHEAPRSRAHQVLGRPHEEPTHPPMPDMQHSNAGAFHAAAHPYSSQGSGTSLGNTGPVHSSVAPIQSHVNPYMTASKIHREQGDHLHHHHHAPIDHHLHGHAHAQTGHVKKLTNRQMKKAAKRERRASISREALPRRLSVIDTLRTAFGGRPADSTPDLHLDEFFVEPTSTSSQSSAGSALNGIRSIVGAALHVPSMVAHALYDDAEHQVHAASSFGHGHSAHAGHRHQHGHSKAVTLKRPSTDLSLYPEEEPNYPRGDRSKHENPSHPRSYMNVIEIPYHLEDHDGHHGWHSSGHRGLHASALYPHTSLGAHATHDLRGSRPRASSHAATAPMHIPQASTPTGYGGHDNSDDHGYHHLSGRLFRHDQPQLRQHEPEHRQHDQQHVSHLSAQTHASTPQHGAKRSRPITPQPSRSPVHGSSAYSHPRQQSQHQHHYISAHMTKTHEGFYPEESPYYSRGEVSHHENPDHPNSVMNVVELPFGSSFASSGRAAPHRGHHAPHSGLSALYVPHGHQQHAHSTWGQHSAPLSHQQPREHSYNHSKAVALKKPRSKLGMYPEEDGSYPRSDARRAHENPAHPSHMIDAHEVQLRASDMHSHHDLHPTIIESAAELAESAAENAAIMAENAAENAAIVAEAAAGSAAIIAGSAAHAIASGVEGVRHMIGNMHLENIHLSDMAAYLPDHLPDMTGYLPDHLPHLVDIMPEAQHQSERPAPRPRSASVRASIPISHAPAPVRAMQIPMQSSSRNSYAPRGESYHGQHEHSRIPAHAPSSTPRAVPVHVDSSIHRGDAYYGQPGRTASHSHPTAARARAIPAKATLHLGQHHLRDLSSSASEHPDDLHHTHTVQGPRSSAANIILNRKLQPVSVLPPGSEVSLHTDHMPHIQRQSSSSASTAAAAHHHSHGSPGSGSGSATGSGHRAHHPSPSTANAGPSAYAQAANAASRIYAGAPSAYGHADLQHHDAHPSRSSSGYLPSSQSQSDSHTPSTQYQQQRHHDAYPSTSSSSNYATQSHAPQPQHHSQSQHQQQPTGYSTTTTSRKTTTTTGAQPTGGVGTSVPKNIRAPIPIHASVQNSAVKAPGGYTTSTTRQASGQQYPGIAESTIRPTAIETPAGYDGPAPQVHDGERVIWVKKTLTTQEFYDDDAGTKTNMSSNKLDEFGIPHQQQQGQQQRGGPAQ